jgi:uncharacterized protein (TIGR02186 family)
VTNKIFAITMIAMACLAGKPYAADTPTALSVSMQPEHIQMGAAFNGAHISVAGEIPSDADAVIRLIGKPEHRRLKQKGRALGVLWMNLEAVEVSKAPNVFLVYLPAGDGAGSDAGRPAWHKLGIGLDGLRRQVDIVARDDNKDALFDEFVKLKEKAGLYGMVENAVQYEQNNGSVKSFNTTLSLPASLPQGNYRLELLAIRNGAVEASLIRNIDAREVGMPAWISRLAFNHGTLYGVLAVLVAVVAGLFTGIMFKGEKGAH